MLRLQNIFGFSWSIKNDVTWIGAHHAGRSRASSNKSGPVSFPVLFTRRPPFQRPQRSKAGDQNWSPAAARGDGCIVYSDRGQGAPQRSLGWVNTRILAATAYRSAPKGRKG